MASRLSESSDASSGAESVEYNHGVKRKPERYSFDDSSEEQSSKMPCLDPSDSYYNKDSQSEEDEQKEDNRDFETPNINSFYKNQFNLKSDEEADENRQSSYYRTSSLSEEDKDDVLEINNDSTKKSELNKTNVGTAKEKNDAASKAERMMMRMGYQKGKGLGKELQGRAEPVSASTQKGRRGLGLELKELKNAHIEFNPDEEVVEAQEEILWLDNPYKDSPSVEEVTEWENERKIGPCKKTIDGEITFCDEIVVKNIINSKSVFDRLDKNEMRDARTRSNPYETIRNSIFLNRAAVKMANIDKTCNFMFTQPDNLQSDDLLYFADVCAGPGGFSEYVLWRKKWRAKGFGFTLKNENDFKLHDFHAGPCETFHPYYGPKEDGNVYDPKNQVALKELIMKQTGDQGVHFMMADGGFSVEGQENIQEILSKQLYLCQCLVALMIVRTGGHFVTKLFDLFTPFSAGLVYIMHRCFDQVSIFKPNTSRPANSERYLICKGKRPDIDHIVDYLFRTNKSILKNKENDKNDILELVPVHKLTSENDFFEYLKDSNEQLGQKQIVGLKKIAAYTEDKSLSEIRQKTMREECLKHWGLPDDARTLPRRVSPSTKAQELLQKSVNVLDKSAVKDAIELTIANVKSTILVNEHDWFCMPCSSGKGITSNGQEDEAPTFYLGTGRYHVYRYKKGSWEQIGNSAIELPRDTLVYAEMVTELRKEGKSQTKTYGLHILDAFTLGAEKVSDKHITERLQLVRLFCKALWKPVQQSCYPVRVKELLAVSHHLDEKIRMETKSMKNGTKVLGYFPYKHSYENDDNNPYYYTPRSVIFFKATEEPWARHKSRTNQMYFFNKQNRQSLWEIPPTAAVPFAKTIANRIIWNWPSDKTFSMNDFINCIKQKYSR
ncbi:hypothetical protein TSAR_001485 [Trichomalopsis sarcophagae]|uniref:Cap-specific mRNA (nucleoside-2'-O-)-methyltransferase 1 n=1 Tax=Trichomalopsis sarcophagae TaxID=543379 RepID=A0A232EU72_9HYME|nr:hypothetical protein TSAR_001485 [Trichomalopsis sarcophagae]